jgi:chromosomal replication initiation ATPase DnaA
METLNSKTSEAVLNYSTLQTKLDTVIGKIGLKKTIQLVENFMDNSSLDVQETEKFKLISSFIISKSIQVFDLKEDQFYDSKIREYREARMACFHLLKKYTDCSYARIGEVFEQKKRNVLYFHQKCEEQLSVPAFFEVFASRYKKLEDYTIGFIAKLD